MGNSCVACNFGCMSIIMEIWNQVIGQKMIEPFKIALSQYDLQEWSGPSHNPEVMKFFEDFPHVTTDETSWCSAFVYWCIKEAGMVPKKSLVARDWLSWGYRYLNRRSGTWPYFTGENLGGWQGHVAFYVKK